MVYNILVNYKVVWDLLLKIRWCLRNKILLNNKDTLQRGDAFFMWKKNRGAFAINAKSFKRKDMFD